MKFSLTAPMAITVVGVLVTAALLIMATFGNLSVWQVRAAIGTLGAVIWAVWQHFIVAWCRRLGLKLEAHSFEPPFLLESAYTYKVFGLLGERRRRQL